MDSERSNVPGMDDEDYVYPTSPRRLLMMRALSLGLGLLLLLMLVFALAL